MRNCARRSPPPKANATNYKGLSDAAGANDAAAQGKIGALAAELEGEKKISARALSQVEILNQQIAALRRQLAAIEQALNASEKQEHGSAARASPSSANGSTSRWRNA